MTIDAVDRTIAIIEQLAENPSGMGIARLAGRLDLAPSTLHRYLANLQRHDIVRQEEDRSYKLTLRLYSLGLRAAEGGDLEKHAESSLKRMARVSEETVCLMVRDGNQSVCIARTGGDQHQLRIEARIGSRSDLRLGATARVLLAYAPEPVREELLARPPVDRRTPNTVTDPDAIRDLLHAIRRDGYYVSQSQVDDGVMAVAAPVHDRSGEVVAAVAVVAPETRMASESVRARIIELVREESRALSASLGFTERSRLVTERELT